MVYTPTHNLFHFVCCACPFQYFKKNWRCIQTVLTWTYSVQCIIDLNGSVGANRTACIQAMLGWSESTFNFRYETHCITLSGGYDDVAKLKEPWLENQDLFFLNILYKCGCVPDKSYAPNLFPKPRVIDHPLYRFPFLTIPGCPGHPGK